MKKIPNFVFINNNCYRK